MATQTVERVLEKEKETEAKLSDAMACAEAEFEEAKKKAEKMYEDIIQAAKAESDNIIAAARAETDKMYDEAKIQAETRRKAIYASADSLKESAADTLSYILF